VTTRWLLASPGTGPHVRQVALALAEASALDTVFVPIAAEATGPVHAVMRTLPTTARLLSRRTMGALGTATIRTRAWPELLRVASARIDRDGRATDAIWEWTARDFSARAARYADPPRTAVYGYESAALELFESARRNGLTRVLEVNSCDADEVMALHAGLAGHDPANDTPYSRRLRRLAPRRGERRRREWDLADQVIVNSMATLESMRRAGRDVGKVRVVPLGCPPTVEAADAVATGTPLRLLFVGTFGVRKGAHVLVTALRDLDIGRPVDVYGKCELPVAALEPARSKLRFAGSIDQNELFELLPQYDLLVLPTLSEGFGMAISEALAHGVPVLTTDSAGASGLIEHGRNGFVVPAGDAAALKSALARAVADPGSLRGMREAARRSAAEWQWPDFRRALRDALGVGQPA
jgi:glycosyltransferase involved in cell wall biosynthesis